LGIWEFKNLKSSDAQILKFSDPQIFRASP
jgi:hypothetical protein